MGLWGTKSTAALATNAFTLKEQPVDGDKLKIGDLIYTFKDTLSSGPAVNGEIKIGANLSATRNNINDAVTHDAGTGTNKNSTYGFVTGSDHSPHQWNGTTQSFNATATNADVDATTDGSSVSNVAWATVNGESEVTLTGANWNLEPKEKFTVIGSDDNNGTFTAKYIKPGSANVLVVEEAVTTDTTDAPTSIEKGFKVTFNGNTGTGREIDYIETSVISNSIRKFGDWDYPSFRGGVDVDESKPKFLTEEEQNEVSATFRGWEKSSIKVAATMTGEVSDLPVNAETVIVAGQTYTFKDSLASANDVKIATVTPTGGSVTDCVFTVQSGDDTIDLVGGYWLKGNLSEGDTVTFSSTSSNNSAFTITGFVYVSGVLTRITVSETVTNETVGSGPTIVGKSFKQTHANLISAINRSGTPGTDYHSGTDANANVTANQNHLVDSGKLPIRITARVAGANGNAIVLSNAGTSSYVFGKLLMEGGQDFIKGSRASAKLTLGQNPGNTETVTVTHFDTGTKVYTFQTSLTDSDGNVKIGASAAESAANLAAAINLDAGAGTTYAASMTGNKSVDAFKYFGEDAVGFRSTIIGERGNTAIATTVTGATLSNSTLVGGKVENELLVAISLQSIEIGTANLIDILINDSSFYENQSDKIIVTLVYNEPVVWVDGGADPQIQLTLAGCAPSQNVQAVIDARHKNVASHRLDFVYTVAADGVHAFNKLTLTDNVTDDDTVTLGAVTYRFKDTMAQAEDVQIGATQGDTVDNLVAAINGTGTAGVEWYTGTTHQNTVLVASNNADNLDVTAIKSGTTANSLTTTDPVDNGSVMGWADTTLGGGTGASVAGTNGARADAGELTINSSITLGGGLMYDTGRDNKTHAVAIGTLNDIDFTASSKTISIQSAGTWTAKPGDKIVVGNTTGTNNDGTFTVNTISSNLKDITVLETVVDQTNETSVTLTTPLVAVNDFTASGHDGSVDLQAAFNTLVAATTVNV